jgi:antitoxin (DNA-binding transcriptional repressor) of toxin-antitoxin stability system
MVAGKGITNIMNDTGSKAYSAPYYGATPITTDELLDNFEPTIDRCAAGETFVIIQDGEPTVFMVPYTEYVALEERAKAAAGVKSPVPD